MWGQKANNTLPDRSDLEQGRYDVFGAQGDNHEIEMERTYSRNDSFALAWL